MQSLKTPTILITGGTGLVGKALTKLLLRQGYAVTILTRRLPGHKQMKGISYALWDVKKQQIDKAAIAEADHIVHLAGAGVVEQKWTPAYQKEIVESRTESSRLLVTSLESIPNTIRSVISMSAIGWYGPDHDPVKPFEESEPASNDFLGETCRLWEAGIDPASVLGKRLVKLRTGIVLANEGGALAEFKKPLRFGVAGILGTGRQIVSWIHIEDLCRMILYSIENENVQGVFNAVAPNPVSNRELTVSLARVSRGKFFVPVRVPSFVLKLMLGQRSIEVLKSATVSARKIQEAGFAFGYKTIDEALQNLHAVRDPL